ncbi:MAG TPA: BrxA/BrxB family bacilliredoxin [Melioribacteraceae bacterium]|mgnify:CR=1 FL=1|nr:BrxA/BrxB family bacilliredoxin [Melioribacteraceae bacterium]
MFNIKKQPLYDIDAVQPMRDEVTFVGFEELTNAESVKKSMDENKDKTVLVFINSVCGCAAGSARPAVTKALQNLVIPDKLFTLFAGQDREAVEFFRSNYLSKLPPSSPSIFLFKNGELIYGLQRMNIEGNDADYLAEQLKTAFDKFCSNIGPSIAKDKYESLEHYKACGSKIPLN